MLNILRGRSYSVEQLECYIKELEQEKIISIEFKSIKINDLNKLKAISKI